MALAEPWHTPGLLSGKVRLAHPGAFVKGFLEAHDVGYIKERSGLTFRPKRAPSPSAIGVGKAEKGFLRRFSRPGPWQLF